MWEIEALLDTAFGVGRLALASYNLRHDVSPIRELAFVARDESGQLVGAIRFWPILIGISRQPALLLGPVAVHPTRQGEGIGSMLIRCSLAKAADLGWKLVLLVGDASYYSRFGFSRTSHTIFPQPVDPARVLYLALVPEAASMLDGEVIRHPGFSSDSTDGD